MGNVASQCTGLLYGIVGFYMIFASMRSNILICQIFNLLDFKKKDIPVLFIYVLLFYYVTIYSISNGDIPLYTVYCDRGYFLYHQSSFDYTLKDTVVHFSKAIL